MLNNILHSSLLIDLLQKTDDENLKQFIKHILINAPLAELQNLDTDYLFSALEYAFIKFIKNNRGVLLFNTPNLIDQFVVNIFNPDIPFLLDSVGNKLIECSFEIIAIIHSTVKVKRSSEGGFIAFSDDGEVEAVIQFFISKQCDEECITNLVEKIESVIECVNHTVSDFLPMKEKMRSLISESNPKHNEFLQWLLNDNFIFLGAFESHNSKFDDIYGIFKSKSYDISVEPLNYNDAITLYKWPVISNVHQIAHMEHIVFKKDNTTVHFIGFFCSCVYFQMIRSIPLIKDKINNVIKKYSFPENSYNCKELITALQAFPRAELIQMSEEELYNVATQIVNMTLTPAVKFFIRNDNSPGFYSCLIFIPKDRYSTKNHKNIEKMFCDLLNGYVSKQYINISNLQLARLQFIIHSPQNNIHSIDVDEIENNIKNIITIWNDDFATRLGATYNKRESLAKFNVYKDAFDIKYTTTFSATQAVADIEFIESSVNEDSIRFNLYKVGDDFDLKIYSPHSELALSQTLPMLENLGLYTQNVLTFKIEYNNKSVFIHRFKLQAKAPNFTFNEVSKQNIEDCLYAILNHIIEDDKFNSLIVYSQLNYHQANVLRAVMKYLKQINFALGQTYAIEALTHNDMASKLLIDLFEARFSPNIQNTQHILDDITIKLSEIKSITEDKVIRAFLNIVMSITRTNYFQRDGDNHKQYLSFKIASQNVIDLPLPKPYAEIFVYSIRFEAIHLRGGKVARGGLRWSDRSEDFRTEVLGLMKAQMTKNAVIVPVGSKGGFYVKQTNNMTKEETLNEAIACYKLFLSGLLDITDNVIDGAVITPDHVYRYDDDDPYLVVAADKGTATFSDYANEISASYNFWLNDAFASGGSAGYDHKKLAITAKGAWISVARHFRSLNVDVQTENFTAVSIGDMSGDVFGNGMLLSPCIKLVAAFNHMHIFLDPIPDPANSFVERKRLFDLPRSQWSDYNNALISTGGGVYSRSDKMIPISKEVGELLSVNDIFLSPCDLIRAILKAPVDLLFNGGIGTYIKASSESNEDIGDKQNDNLRINGKDLRAKVVGEGGNLGFTQLGRIEYASGGGKINTDFIDNSGGVDCSDHEVNIKIAFSQALKDKRITIEQRNKLLAQMVDEVTYLVLKDNVDQTQIINLEEENGIKRLDQHAWLIKYLETHKELDREIEYLPNKEKIATLKTSGNKLTRPEIAVLIAYAKSSIYKLLCVHNFSDDVYFNRYLLSYFPLLLQTDYQDLILAHKLKNEIIATQLTNQFINILGCTYFHQIFDDMSCDAHHIIKAFSIIIEIYDIKAIWKDIEALTGVVPPHVKISLFKELQTCLERNIEWLLLNEPQLDDIEAIIFKYKQYVGHFQQSYKTLISNDIGSDLSALSNKLSAQNVPIPLIEQINNIKATSNICDIVSIASLAKVSFIYAAKVFFNVGQKMSINWMLTQAKRYLPTQHIDNVALNSLIAEIESLHIQLAVKELNISDSDIDACQIIKPIEFKQYNEFISELRSVNSNSWVSLLVVAIRRIKEYLNG